MDLSDFMLVVLGSSAAINAALLVPLLARRHKAVTKKLPRGQRGRRKLAEIATARIEARSSTKILS